MDEKKSSTDRKYTVEKIGSNFMLVDWETGNSVPCPVGTTRAQAEQRCAAHNGTGNAKTPRDPLSIEYRLELGEKLTIEEVDATQRLSGAARHPYCGPLDPDIYGKLRTRRVMSEEQQRRHLVANFDQWLIPALKEWGHAVAEYQQCQHWSTDQVLAECGMWSTAEPAFTAIKGRLAPDIRWMVRGLVLLHDDEDHHDDLQVVCAHFVSAAPARLKAEHFGVEKRAYLARVRSACQRLAHWLVEYAEEVGDPTDPDRARWAGFGAATWNEVIAIEEMFEHEDDRRRPATRRGRSSNPPRRPAKRSSTGLSDTEAFEASIASAAMARLRAAFGRPSNAETIPAGESLVENKRSLGEAGINPNDVGRRGHADKSEEAEAQVRKPADSVPPTPRPNSSWSRPDNWRSDRRFAQDFDPAERKPYPDWAKK